MARSQPVAESSQVLQTFDKLIAELMEFAEEGEVTVCLLEVCMVDRNQL